ncbi:hypothetical protein J7M22_10550 [Candidatus Poribacteria bacterium]|nr:hypothetical protein [Candidatus Poribacteria bacterium]
MSLLFLIAFIITPASALEWKQIMADYRIECMAMHPTKPIIFVGTINYGIYKTTDRGETWKRTDNGIHQLAWIYSIAINPHDPDQMFVGTELRLYRSIDGGESWTPVKEIGTTSIFSVHFDAVNPRIIYAGPYKSTDGGRSWKEMNIPPKIKMKGPLLFVDPRRSGILYVRRVIGLEPPELYKSTDGGASWKKIGKGIFRISIDPFHPDILYGSSWQGIYKSTNGGESWKLMKKGMELPPGVGTDVLVNPINPNVIYGMVGKCLGGLNATTEIYISENGGEEWRLLDEFPGDKSIRCYGIHPLDPDYLYIGTEKGAWRCKLPPVKPYSVDIEGKRLVTWGRIKGRR